MIEIVNRKGALGVIECRWMPYGCQERLLEWLPTEILHVWSGYLSKYFMFRMATYRDTYLRNLPK